MITSTKRWQSFAAWARADLPCIAALAMLAALFWRWDILANTSPQPVFAGFDLFSEFFPRHHYAGEALRAGRIPLWDPTQAAGLPFVATWQGGFFYPPNLLYGLLPTGLAMGILARLHIFLGGVFAYLLGAELRLSRTAALLSAVTYMLCGSTVFMIYHTCAIDAVPWLPAALLAAWRLERRPSASASAALAVVLAMLFLAGRDFAVVMTLQAVALLTLFQTARRLREPAALSAIARHFGFLAAAGVLTVGLIAVQAFPTLELAARSGRTIGGLPAAMLEPFGSMPPRLFLANLVNPLRGPIRREYMGWIPLACAWIGLFAIGRRPAAAYFAVLGAVSLVLVFGTQTSAYALYAHLPLSNVFRLPDRFVYLFSISIALLAGFGLDQLFEKREGRGASPSAGIAALAAFCVFIGVGAVTKWLRAGVEQANLPWGWFPFYGFTIENFGGLGMAAAYAAVALAMVVAARAISHRSAAGAVKFAFVVLAAADLLFAFRSVTFHPEISTTEATSAEGCYRKLAPVLGDYGRHLSIHLPDSSALKDKNGELFGNFSATHYDPLVTQRHAVFFSLLQEGGTFIVDSPWNKTSAFMGMLMRGPAADRLKFLDLLGVRAVLIDGRPGRRPAAFAPLVASCMLRDSCVVDGANGPVPVSLLENPHAMPRASVLFDVVETDDITKAADLMARPGFDPARTVVLESSAPAPAATTPAAAARATIAAYSENRVVVHVETAAPGVLLLTDTWDPEWTATVNGQPTAILPADVLFRGVPVAKGSSEIVFEYRPRSFYVGALVTLLSLVAGAAWVLLSRSADPARNRSAAATD